MSGMDLVLFYFPRGHEHAAVSSISRDSTHQKEAVNRARFNEERERVQHARLLATTARIEVPAQQSPVHPITLTLPYTRR